MSKATTQKDLTSIATFLRRKFKERNRTTGKEPKYILLYAYNGTGKTRLSVEFKNAGKKGDKRDTLYFNAFTEDLFTWDNDLASDSARVLRMNSASTFFAGLQELEMESRIRSYLHRYTDVDFRIDYAAWTISFSRTVGVETFDNIKVSRGEENIFIWCFFMAIVELALDGEEAYTWVKYIYIDDPISSLDDNNVIAVATDLARLLLRKANTLKTVISSHHTLFFNVLWHELREDGYPYFLSSDKASGCFHLRSTRATPYFHHVATLIELYKAAQSGNIYTYHFNMLRGILEKTASFHGFDSFSACVKQDADDIDGIIHKRLIDLMSHGNYSLYERQEMLEDNKAYFRKILSDFMSRYTFNADLFKDVKEP